MKNNLILIIIISLLLISCKENSNYDDKFEIFNELLDRELNLAGWRGTPNSYAEDAKEGRNFHSFQTDELILTMRSDSTYTLIYDPSKSIVGVNQPPKKQNGKYIYRNGQIILDRPFFGSEEASSFDDGEYKSFFLINEKINITADSIVELDFRNTSGRFQKFYVNYFILASSMTDNMDDIKDFDEFALEHLNSLELDYKNVTRYVKLLKINKSKQKNYPNNVIVFGPQLENEEKMIEDNQVSTNTSSNVKENEIYSNRLPVMSFLETEHDFGTITQGTNVEHLFVFTNTGNAPLIIKDAKGSCGCTVPEYTKIPIPPGGEGEILVKYNGSGMNQRRIRVNLVTNTKRGDESLTIKAFVTQ